MRRSWAFLLAPVLAGCLSAHVPDVSHWNIVADPPLRPSSAKAAYGVTRLSQVVVCAPYDERTITVYRSDNTMAEDPYNVFASVPSRLLREPARTMLASSGRFRSVVGSSSSATASHIVEITVTDFRLDCSRDEAQPDRREAVVEVFLLVLDGNRSIAGSARGGARRDARDGDYGAAFSKAFSEAMEAALDRL